MSHKLKFKTKLVAVHLSAFIRRVFTLLINYIFKHIMHGFCYWWFLLISPVAAHLQSHFSIFLSNVLKKKRRGVVAITVYAFCLCCSVVDGFARRAHQCCLAIVQSVYAHRLISFHRSCKALCSLLSVAFIIQIISLGICLNFPPTLSSTNVFVLEVTAAEYGGGVRQGKEEKNQPINKNQKELDSTVSLSNLKDLWEHQGHSLDTVRKPTNTFLPLY